MNFDYERLSRMGDQIDHMLGILPYPIDKDELVERAQQTGAHPELVVAMRQILPETTFTSPQDVKKFLTGQQGQTWM